VSDLASVKARSALAEATGSRFRVILVEPEKEGNIGSVARSMKNFGLTDLRLVSPKTAIGDEAYRYATRGQDILDTAKVFKTLPDALRDASHVVGTTAITGKSTRNLLRITIDSAQLAPRMAETTGSVALLFGRESSGLTNAELQQCNLIVNIPASDDYNVLNLATAASIVFYEIFKETRPAHAPSLQPSRQSLERLASIFLELAEAADIPAHRRRLADRAFRNVLAKSVVSRREVSLIMGVLRRIRDKVQAE
jgi:TrmH family RNA methyltransferase